MSLLRADKISNRFNNTGPIIVGPSTISGNFTVTGILTALGIGVTNSINVGQAITTKYLTSTNGTSLFNTNLTGITTAGIVTGATYYGNGVHLSGVVTSVYPGPGVQISPISGQGRVKISATGVAVAGYSTNAGLSTDVKGGTAGAVLWQIGPNDTGFTAVGNAGEILQSTGTSAPIWTNVTAINVAYADSAGISTNLRGGSSGRIPYQTGIDATGFLPIGSTGKILLGQGTVAPIWIDPKASLDVRYSNLSGIATNVIGGVSSVTSLNVTGITTLGGGNVTVQNDLNVNGITTSNILVVPGTGIIGTLNVSGVTTTQFLEVTGVTTLASLGVSGSSVFNSNIDVNGHTELDNLSVLGVSTFVGVSTFQNDLYVGGDLYITDDLVFDEFTARNGSITGIGTIYNLDTNTGTIDYLTNTYLNSIGIATFGQLYVSGPSTFNNYVTITGFTTFGSSISVTNDLNVSGISSVGTAITMYPSTGIVSATAFYGDGSNITGISSTPIVTNILYVTTDGDDINNDGNTIESAKRTVGAALTLATTSTVIKVSAGNYFENNPLIVPEQVSIQGDSLREVSLSPQNSDEDFIYVSNGDYIDNISFTGTLDSGKAVIAFNPNKPSYINQGPYIRNCTNFITNSIGMKIDGYHAIGDTKSMSVDSYTQYNQGGIGVSISNEGYAQLVSIFTICTDQSIVCLNGGACDLTNSNSSFGRLGLVADGIGPKNFTGNVSIAEDADSDTFTINVGVNTLGVTTAVYDNTTGLLTVTTDSNHGFNVGKSIEIRDLEFSCNSGPGIVTYPSGNYGYIFTVNSVGAANSFSAYVGVSTLSHNYERSGVISEFISRPYDGQVAYFDELYNSITGVTVVNGGNGYGNSPPTVTFDDPSEPWGIRATGIANLTNGSVTSVDIVSSGRGYTTTPNVTFSPPPSGTTATGTANILPTYYVVSSATPIVNGITTVTFTENVPYTVGVGTSVPFFKQSRVLASSHAFEYIGSGNTIGQALPQRGGVGIQENEIISQNGGLVVYTSTDQAGNFRIGDGVIINQLEGSISGQAYGRSLFANITPYILALGGNK